MELKQDELDTIIREEIENVSAAHGVYPLYHQLLKTLGPNALLEELVSVSDKKTLKELLNKIKTQREILNEAVGKKVKNLIHG